jgi:hypothetical protein
LYIFVCFTAQRLILGIVDSTLLYQSILAISSAISALYFKSFLQKGIFNKFLPGDTFLSFQDNSSKPVFSIQRFFKISIA